MEVPDSERMHAKRSIEEDIESCSAHLQSLQIEMEDLADELAALMQGSRSDGPGRAIRDLRMSLDGASDALSVFAEQKRRWQASIAATQRMKGALMIDIDGYLAHLASIGSDMEGCAARIGQERDALDEARLRAARIFGSQEAGEDLARLLGRACSCLDGAQRGMQKAVQEIGGYAAEARA